ncbi:hypothetical protein IJ750_06535, partial [bacterium]|nr:hypothetical protein [bacterium]
MILRNIDAQSLAVKNVTKGKGVQETAILIQPEVKSMESKKGSQALSSYFRGGQMVSFEGHPCAKSDFKVKREEGIPCACCGRMMMTNNGVKNFESKAVGAKGEDLQNLLAANKDYFRGTEKAVANFLFKTSKMNPNLTMKGLLTHYSPNAKAMLEEEQYNVLDEVLEKAKVLGKNNEVEKCVQQARKDIRESTDEVHFERKPFLKKFVEVTSKLEDKELAGQLLDTAVKLPMSQNSIEAFIVKYAHGDKDDLAIAHRLVQPSIATAEHIHPDTLGGPDNTSNYVAECGDCNSKRGHMPLEEWMENFPNMPRSVQRNINEVTERIINGNLGGRYDDYPLDIQATMARETGGIIQLEVKNPEEIDKAREVRVLPKHQPS